MSKIFALTLLLCFAIIHPVLGAKFNRTDSDYVTKLKSIADQMEYYPLECHVFPAAQIALRLNTSEISTYFEFTSLARNATDKDRESCIPYLDDATPKERALILVVLFFAQDTKYLPIIARSLSDTEVAFTGTTKDVIETTARNLPTPRESSKAPEGSYMHQKWRDLTDSSAGFSELELTRNRPLPVSTFAAVILGNWGCFPDLSPQDWVGRAVVNQQENSFSSEYWSQFDRRKNLLRSWHVKYLVEVCSFPIECHEQKLIQFLEKIKELPPRDCVLVFWRINVTSYTSFTSGDLFLAKGDRSLGAQYLFLKNWKFPYKKIPKDELIELLTTKNPEEIDEWLGGPLYTSLIQELLRQRGEMLEKEEFEKLRPRFNPIVEKWFIAHVD